MNREHLRTQPALALLAAALFLSATATAREPLQPSSRGTVEVPRDHRQPGGPKRTLAYQRFGHPEEGKTPLLLLHGGPGKALAGAGAFLGELPVGQALRAHYDVVVFDQRGAGASLLAEEQDSAHVKRHLRHYRLAQYVEDIEAVRVALFGAQRKVAILGSSWGGFLGMEYALRYPGSVAALMLGSFESTSDSTGDTCGGFDHVLLVAEQEDAELARALAAFREAVSKGRLRWHAGRPEQRSVQLTDLFAIGMPYASKARHAELARVLEQATSGTAEGRALLDDLDLSDPEVVLTLGGSLPGHATFCQELVSTESARQRIQVPPAALWCDRSAYARGLTKACEGYAPRARRLDNGPKLSALRVPTLLFAGRLDPITPWEPTARTAALVPDSSFVLVEGGHSPFREGGTCLADVVERFARGERPGRVRCGAGPEAAPLTGGVPHAPEHPQQPPASAGSK
jgi:pimeloyl-ACP methyl ester carboxylesterase